jgi:4-hydroxy-tetrahydrodipicolinate synthase
MVTPFDDSLRLDLDAAATVARWLVDHGSDGLVVAGTTGESPTLSDGEKLDLFRAVREAVTVPIVAGTGTYDTAHSVHLTKEAVRTGVDAVLAVTPYYNKPSQAGIAAHFTAVAEAAGGLPVMVYDIEGRTGRPIKNDTLLSLARDVTNLVAVKDASGDIPQAAYRCAHAPAGFDLYSGNDGDTLPLMAVGAAGLVGVASHWAGSQFQDMIAAYLKGDVETARDLNFKLLDSCEFFTSDVAPSPLPAKAMMRTLGLPVGHARPPMGPDEPADLEARARKVYAQLGA